MKIEKVLKQLPTGFKDDADAMSDEQLTECVMQSEANIRDTERDREADDKLKGAKDLVKDLGAGYRDAVKAQRAKIAYVMHLREERGLSEN